MKLNRLFVAAAAALVPAAVASAYTLSVSSPPQLAAPPLAASTATLVVSLDGAAGESILSAQALLQVQGGPAALTLSGGTGLGAGTIFGSYSDSNTGNLSTQSANSPNAQSRYRALFVPVDEDGNPVAQTLINGTLMTVVLNIPAGLPAGSYPIVFIGAGSPGGSDATDTFVGLSSLEQKNPAAAVGSTLVVLPEPASALLLLGALPFLRRRSA